jgi:multimeric flavodoxin WrbA
MPKVKVVKLQPSVALSRAEFERRFRERFYDPAFEEVEDELKRVINVAWEAYHEYRKSPRTRAAGKGFQDPKAQLPVEWLEARKAIHDAEKRQRNPGLPSRILLISGSSRSSQTCPGETPKTWRLAKMAERAIKRHRGFEVDFLDLSLLAAEYGRVIYPCKACVSTAMPLCHWPCSCYPNHAMGQAGDWMNEIYPRWAAAHGVMIVCPVNWYQAPSTLKLMIDRLVCADGGNPDPTTTNGKDPKLAKELELKGWDYPQHLAGRGFSVAVHGDVAGVEMARSAICDWLRWIGLIQAGEQGTTASYVGYYQPYATSHDDLDKDKGFQGEVRNAAEALVNLVRGLRSGKFKPPDQGLTRPRRK